MGRLFHRFAAALDKALSPTEERSAYGPLRPTWVVDRMIMLDKRKTLDYPGF